MRSPARHTIRPARQGGPTIYLYLPMRDGTRLAIGVWFPDGRVPERPVPVVLIQTRYGRAATFIHGENGFYSDLLKRGYAVAIVDTRGSTASFGPRDVELSPAEVADMDELIRYFKTRPWANGEVFATGVSYMADTADLATASPAHLTGAVIREADFDAYLGLFDPGGVSNDLMMSLWGGDTVLRDLGRSLDPRLKLDCGARVERLPETLATPAACRRRQAIFASCAKRLPVAAIGCPTIITMLPSAMISPATAIRCGN